MTPCLRLTQKASLILVLGAFERAAYADEQDACIAAYMDGQRLQRSGALRRARQDLLVCARDPCSKVLQRDCVTWLDEIEARMPSIVVQARDARGQDIVLVRIFIDKEIVANRLDGRPIDLDPGEHLFRFEAEGKQTLEHRMLIHDGDRGRRLSIELRDVPPTSEPEARPANGSPGVPWTFFALSGLGLASLGSFAYFGLKGISDRDDLGACRGECETDRVSDVRTSFRAADISLGIATVSLAAAAIVFFTHPRAAKGSAR